MSKTVVRVFFSVLIALALVAVVFTSVQGAMLNAGTKSAQVSMKVGVKQSMLHTRTSSQNLDNSGIQAENYDKPEHDCNHDSMINPEDY